MNQYELLAKRVEALESERAALTQRLGLLEDEAEIKRLQRTYGYYLDNRMWDAMADLFADSGSIEIGRRGRYVGRERLRRFFRDVLGRGRDGLLKGEIINHLQLQGIVHVDPSRASAKGRWRVLLQGSPPPGETYMVSGEGIYENTYVVEDGRWKIATMWWAATFYVNIPGHETIYFNSTPKDEAFPPDNDSVPQNEALGRSFLPFHYVHPITQKSVPLTVQRDSTDHVGYRMDHSK